MAKALQFKGIEDNVHGNLGRIAAMLCDIDQARREFEQTLELHESIGISLGEARTCQALEDLGNLAGHAEEASQLWHRAEALRTNAEMANAGQQP